MNPILEIDTSDSDRVRVCIRTGISGVEKTASSRTLKAQTVLPLVEAVLLESGTAPGDIAAIRVARGPGSFTGLRVGISVANALAFALGIGVNGRKAGEIETPVYT